MFTSFSPWAIQPPVDSRQGSGYSKKSDNLPQICDSLIIKMVPILPLSLSGPPIVRLRVLHQEVESISGPLGWPPDLPWPTECRGSDSIPVPSASIRPPPHSPLPQGTVPLPAEQVQLSLLAEEGLRSTELNRPLFQLKPQAPDGAQPRASSSGTSPIHSQSIIDTRVSPMGTQL